MKSLKTSNAFLLFAVFSLIGLIIMSQKPELIPINPWAGSRTINDDLYRLGNVGIGTAETGEFKLAVEGKIGAREIVVHNDAWADFVFDEQYELMPLLKLEEFYKTNKHLPGIPDAQVVAKEGVNVGEMQTKLLQKVEELTLYMVELKKENALLKKRIELLEK